MLYIEKKREMTEYFRSIPMEQKQQLYRGIRSIIAQLVKVSKMTEIYDVHDKIFEEFSDTMKQNMDLIHNLLPYASVTTKKVGFYYQEKKIKLFDQGERKFRNIFLSNEIRELYFVKGVTKEEIVNFFAVIKETLNYTLLDYDFNTRLWDYGITHIGTISDPDMGDPEPWNPEWVKNTVKPKDYLTLVTSKTPTNEDISNISTEFEGFLQPIGEEFENWLKSHGKDFTVKKYLEKAVSIVTSGKNKEMNKKMVGKICEYTVLNISNGDFISGFVYLKTLLQMMQLVDNSETEIINNIKETIGRINDEGFLDAIFEKANTVDAEQVESFADLINVISMTNFDLIFVKVCECANKDIRIQCLKWLAKNMKSSELVGRYLENPDWHVVRNFLYILRYTDNPEFLPLVRNVMNHETKQVRVEAANVLSVYSADENMEYWEKAVFSPDEDVRILAVENLLKVRDVISVKQIFNEIFKQENRSKFNYTDYERYTDRILSSGREELFDLPGSLIFSEVKELRMIILSSLNKLNNPSMFLMQIKRRITSPEFLTLDPDEIDQILKLMKGEMTAPMLEHLEYLFTLHGNIFKRDKYLPLKKQVFDFVKQRSQKNLLMRSWIEKGKSIGDAETKNILNGGN